MTENEPWIEITRDGPYIVHGDLPLIGERVTFDGEGYPLGWEKTNEYEHPETYALCRCGNSKNMPFCDGRHLKKKFKGRETREKHTFLEKARRLTGRNLILYDAKVLCMGVGFCHRAGEIWKLYPYTDDPDKRRIAVEEAWACPAGRLVVADKKTDVPIEPDFEPHISIITDPRYRVISPLWVKGYVRIVLWDGTEYERRNRVTLCACGESAIQPFCNGRHYFG
jgi:CDGSH-type Zn-finger protein